MYTHESSLNHFLEWCEQESVEDMNELTGRMIERYINWRVMEAPDSVDKLSPKSEKTQIDITRKFIEHCAAIEAVPVRLHEKIQSPQLKQADEVREEMLEWGRIEDIIDYLNTYQYASRAHVIWTLLAETGMRIGALQSLDVGDFDAERQVIQFRYRPESGTSLKNDIGSERTVALIRDDTPKIIGDYIDKRRIAVADNHNRRPLITTKFGRIADSTLRKTVYKWSCPKELGQECSHEESMTTSSAWRCENNAYPHMLRRSAITHLLRNDVPLTTVSDRCDVSPAVIKTHYDGRSEQERATERRRIIEKNLKE
jgi:integrase